MTNEQLKEKILTIVPQAQTEQSKQYLNVVVAAADLRKLCLELKNNADLAFDYMFCLSGVDDGKILSVVYHLNSVKHKHSIVVKIKTDDRVNATVDTVCDIWLTANPLEREVFEMYGITFTNHPDLRLLLLDETYKGYPLRKDYVDEVNMLDME